jgi:hypothetical protein
MTEVPAWLLSTLAIAIAAVEIAAIATRKQGDTISERLRVLLGIKPRRWWRPIGIIGVCALAGWFVIHLIFN